MRNPVILAAIVLMAFVGVTLGAYLLTKDDQTPAAPAPEPAPEIQPQDTASEVPQTPGDGHPRNRARMDVNADGTITYEEASAAHPEITREQFQARDTNGDGVWNADEGFGQGSGMGPGRGMRGQGGGGRGMRGQGGGGGGRGMHGQGGGAGGGYRGNR